MVSASASFFNLFGTRAADTIDQDFFRLDGGQWDIPDASGSGRAGVRGQPAFSGSRCRTRILPAWAIAPCSSPGSRFQSGAEGLDNVLLAIDDITSRARVESLGSALERIGLGMVSSFDVDEILQRAVTEAAGALGCNEAMLAVPARGSWMVRFALGEEEPAGGTVLTGGIARQFSALSPGQRAVVTTSRTRGSAPSPGERAAERVHAALTVRDEVVGVISFGELSSRRQVRRLRTGLHRQARPRSLPGARERPIVLDTSTSRGDVPEEPSQADRAGGGLRRRSGLRTGFRTGEGRGGFLRPLCP